MEDTFLLEVTYKGEACAFPARLQLLGYVARFVVELPHNEVWFERDEEGAYRALLPPDALENGSTVDVQLLQTIAAKIEAILA